MLLPVRQFADFRRRAALVSEAIGCDLLSELESNAEQALRRNLISSLATVLVSTLLVDRLRECLSSPPSWLAGYSVGQFVALYAAGILSFEGLIELLRVRCGLMDEDFADQPGAMLAVIGLPEERVQALCAEISADGPPLVISNFNAVGHYSLAGSEPVVI